MDMRKELTEEEKEELKQKKQALEEQIKRLMKEEVFFVDANGKRVYFYYDTFEERLFYKSQIRGTRMEVKNPRETLIALISGKSYHDMIVEDVNIHRTSIMSIRGWKLAEDF